MFVVDTYCSKHLFSKIEKKSIEEDIDKRFVSLCLFFFLLPYSARDDSDSHVHFISHICLYSTCYQMGRQYGVLNRNAYFLGQKLISSVATFSGSLSLSLSIFCSHDRISIQTKHTSFFFRRLWRVLSSWRWSWYRYGMSLS